MTRSKRSNKTTILSVALICLSVLIILASSLAFFTDKRDTTSGVNFGKIEISTDENFKKLSVPITDVLPGSKLTDAITFSKAVDSEPMYVRAKVYFDTTSEVLAVKSLVTTLNSFDIGVAGESDLYQWSGNYNNFYYLLDKNDYNKVYALNDTSIITLTNGLVLPTSIESLEDNAQYFEKITLNVEIQAVQIMKKGQTSQTNNDDDDTTTEIGTGSDDLVILVIDPDSDGDTMIGIDAEFEDDFGESYISKPDVSYFTFDGATVTGLSEVGKNAKLSTMTIPEVSPDGTKITSIGQFAFGNSNYEVQALPKVVAIPDSVTSIGMGAFAYCGGLDSIILPKNLVSIGDYAFACCYNLKSISLPNSLTSLGAGAFNECGTLKEVVIPNGVVSIGQATFYDCDGLTNFVVPSNVTSIGRVAFAYCDNLKSVTLSKELESIGGYAFSGCTSLTSIDLPNSLTNLGEGAFRSCSSLKSITIPGSVPCVGYETFYCCEDLESVTLLNGITTLDQGAFVSCTKLVDITIPSSVTSMGEDIFRRCESLKNITIPSGVTSIGRESFLECSKLESVTFGENSQLTSIDYSAFNGCSSLTSITIPSGVTSIDGWAFANCSVLTSIVIPSGVTSIGDGAFTNCPSLISIIVESGNIVYNSGESCNAIIETDSNTLIVGCKTTIIPNSVTSIGESAFWGCSGLTSITIPEGVTCLKTSFSGCTGLTSIVILGRITRIEGGYNFGDCTNAYLFCMDSGTQSMVEFTGIDNSRILLKSDVTIDSGANWTTLDSEHTDIETVTVDGVQYYRLVGQTDIYTA